MKHIVYFEIYGKKMKAEVIARDAVTAKTIIKEKIIFHKIEAVPILKKEDQDLFQNLKDMLGMK